jgi:hypothetical protein
LTNAGYSIQFVGGSQEPWNGVFEVPTNIPSPDLRNIGGVNQDKHRGYGGYSTPIVRDNINSWLAADNPDIVLLMIGINDYGSGNGSVAPGNLTTILSKIFAANSSADVIVAQITPMSSGNTMVNNNIAVYNSFIRNSLVPTYRAQGKRVSTVDQYSNMLNNGAIDDSLFSNGINHPGLIAYDRMAETWFQGIQAVHPIPEPSSFVMLFAAGAIVLGFGRLTRKFLSQ